MVSLKSVEKQLKSIHFSARSWGKGEISELPNILMDDEKIFECVNGSYEGGFALLCATNIRLLLIDKKPMKFLTVEDLRFDMINQIDYSHRLMGARINICTGVKNLRFTSFNQQRLRKLINHIQHRMADIKREQSSSAETQQQHLEKINQQLQTYLLAQHQQQEDLRLRLEQSQQGGQAVATAAQAPSVPVRPAPELADFLFAQSLMQQYQAANPTVPAAVPPTAPTVTSLALQQVPLPPVVAAQPVIAPSVTTDTDSLVEAGRREIFGAKARAVVKPLQAPLNYLGTEINPLRIAYAKLPLALRNRRRFTAPSVSRTILPDHGGLPGSNQVLGA